MIVFYSTLIPYHSSQLYVFRCRYLCLKTNNERLNKSSSNLHIQCSCGAYLLPVVVTPRGSRTYHNKESISMVKLKRNGFCESDCCLSVCMLISTGIVHITCDTIFQSITNFQLNSFGDYIRFKRSHIPIFVYRLCPTI